MTPKYGRDDDTWNQLVEAGHEFLIERVRLGRPTSYTELNAVLVARTGLSSFDFARADERAAMGHLLGLIVELDLPRSKAMISAMVHYLGANDAGSGFYKLAVELGLLAPNATSAQRDKFWIRQFKALREAYPPARAGSATRRTAAEPPG